MTKLAVFVLSVKVEGAGVTISVTGIVTGATPVTVTVTAELYVFADKLFGFTRTVRLPGSLPPGGLTVSQRSAPGLAVVKVGVPELAFMVTDWAAGKAVAPI